MLLTTRKILSAKQTLTTTESKKDSVGATSVDGHEVMNCFGIMGQQFNTDHSHSGSSSSFLTTRVCNCNDKYVNNTSDDSLCHLFGNVACDGSARKIIDKEINDVISVGIDNSINPDNNSKNARNGPKDNNDSSNTTSNRKNSTRGCKIQINNCSNSNSRDNCSSSNSCRRLRKNNAVDANKSNEDVNINVNVSYRSSCYHDIVQYGLYFLNGHKNPKTQFESFSKVLRILAILVLSVLLSSYPHGVGCVRQQDNNLIRGNALRDHDNSDQGTNSLHQHATHRGNFQGSNANLSFLDDIEKNCPKYCVGQAQYNSICVNKGCKQWKTGLAEGCGFVCNGSEAHFREFYSCQVGCSKAIEDYYPKITEMLGVPDPPTLISDSLKSTSLRLSWEGSALPLPYLVFTIQRRFYHRNNQWETLPSSSQQPLNQTLFTVQGLKPYTEYQFRIGWIFAHDYPPYYSLESNPIETLPSGLPNPPEITSIQPISNTSVSVTWLPPSQPNGKLVAYILKLQILPSGHFIIKEIPIIQNQNPRGYTFYGLQPMTNYSLAISAQNLEGEGEVANINFVTPQSSISNDISKRAEPRLLLQGIKDVYIQDVDLLMDPDISIFTSNQNITAIAAHFKFKWVFIATSEGQVIRTGFDKNQTVVILPKEDLDIFVSFMSVDWLHGKLYLVGKKKGSVTWIIQRCELDGRRLRTIYNYLGTKPTDFAADPYTGYLYWVSPPLPSSRGVLSTGGLYKMDLPVDSYFNLNSNIYNPVPVLLGSGLGPFTVDSLNYRILIVSKENNTILSVSLDGDVADIRRNTQTPQFDDVDSICSYSGIFYWTTGQNVVMEEYNSDQDSFYHNSFAVPKVHQPCSRLIILHPDLQPTPVPMAVPQKPQVIYGQTRARISWNPPPIIAGLGDASWRKWKYQIKLSDNTTYSNISGLQYIVENLRPSAFYSIQIRAYSPSGNGPYSAPIRGKTLRETPYNITFLWGSQSGLYSTNTLGENVQLLASPSQWRNGSENDAGSKMWSLAWYESSVFFALSNGSVFYYESEDTRVALNSNLGPKVSRLLGVSFAQSVAFDYIGQKLYWSNPKQQTILRCSFSSQNRSFSDTSVNCGSVDKAERLQVVTMAKEITIDSYKGLLLWSTGHSLEMSKLNGYSHTVLHQTGLFSGIQIMGITLDTDQSRIYWITKSSTGSSLQRLSYNFPGAQLPMVIANYDDVSITGPIRYFNDRLIWLQGSSEAVITDLYDQGKSSLTVSTISNITNIHVKDQSALRYPVKDRHKVQVTPNSVSNWTIVIHGKSNNFTISWQPVNNINHGKMFYDVLVNNTISRITTSQNITVENNSTFIKPYTELEISITAVTYWASSKPTVVRLKTPSSKPSEPLNPRVFLQKSYYRSIDGTDASQYGNESITAELRWDAPLYPNGIILGYLIHCWKDSTKEADCMCEMDLTKLSCEIHNLFTNTQYRFAVQAYTEAGSGKLTSKVLADIRHSNPVPKLLLVTLDKLEVLDIDRNEMQQIPSGHLPVTATYLSSDNTVYWFYEGQDLMKSKIGAHNKSRIWFSGSHTDASHLTIDWIGRKLYWAMQSLSNDNPEAKYGIMVLDLYSLDTVATPKMVVKSHTPIKSIAVNPFRSTLFWTTSRRNGITTLFTSEMDGSAEKPFLIRDNLRCNCSSLTAIGDAVALDPNGLYDIPRGILLSDQQSIWLSDEYGCNCAEVVNITAHTLSKSITPPYCLAADEHHVYWAAKSLYASDKPGLGITELSSSSVREVSVFGPNAQPYPDSSCLIPKKLEPMEPLLFNHSSHSLHLQLPKPVVVNCTFEKISLPTPKYRVYYGTVDENGISECTPSSDSFCKVVQTLENMLHINDLHPYTTYTVFVTVTNFYAEKEKAEALKCSPIMLRTAPGAPMPPKLLRLEPVTPNSVRVVWGQPEKLNGEKVWYEVNWKITGSPSSKFDGRKWTESDARSNKNRTEFDMDVTELLAASNYTMWVVAYSEKGDAFSESVKKFVQTRPQPNNLTLIRATPHNLTVVWIPPNDTSILRHQIVYHPGWSSYWNETPLINFTVPNRPYNLTVINLKPKTLYGFRLKTWYNGDRNDNFEIWPKVGQFDMETLADKPGRPGQPVAKGIGKSLYEVSWEKPEENGATVEIYSLEYKIESNGQQHIMESENNNENGSYINLNHHNRRKREWVDGKSIEVAEKLVSNDGSVNKKLMYSQWTVVYNGTVPRWQVSDLDLDTQCSFRARAKNVYGWGEYSQESNIISLAALTIVAEPQSIGVIIGMILLTCVLLGALGLLFIYIYRQKQKEKPALQNGISSERQVELATLRELPGGSSFIHQSNILYSAGFQDLILDLDFAGLPQISQKHIILKKFLGSGAFGEVYEGLAGNLPGNEGTKSRVAIKTLRKGATNVEKMEFVREAKLMTQFRHPHILQLLGICVDTDPCCLLLELMEGGDLLSYLRINRPNLGSSTCISLVDLLRMCVDVAKGCVYLEELHFVHRDLAARNCLVRINPSTGADPGQYTRVVKIGDFGLARDIYRNDYYRKEGEGLLPVRWMAPESLVDGVFTTQTDVWAFGIILWEIMTLGQQPYPAKTNSDVLHFVRSGGRLDQPPHCPSALTHLMLQCWEYNPENRPSFRVCQAQLDVILQNYEEITDVPLPGLPRIEEMHVSSSQLGYPPSNTDSTTTYYRRNGDSDSVFIPQNPHSQINYNAHVSPHFPKYLEVLGDSGGDVGCLHSFSTSATLNNSTIPPDTDQGYEIPLPKKPPRNPIRYTPSTSSNAESTEILGLPTYLNTETLPLAQSKIQTHRMLSNNCNSSNSISKGNANQNKFNEIHNQSDYRNLLPSSTSEDADFEHEFDGEQMDEPEFLSTSVKSSPTNNNTLHISKPTLMLYSAVNYQYQKNLPRRNLNDLTDEEDSALQNSPSSPNEYSPFNEITTNTCANSHKLHKSSANNIQRPSFHEYNLPRNTPTGANYVNQHLHHRGAALMIANNPGSNSRSCINAINSG